MFTKDERQATLDRVKALFAVDGLTISKEAEGIFQQWIDGQITDSQRAEMIIEMNSEKIRQSAK